MRDWKFFKSMNILLLSRRLIRSRKTLKTARLQGLLFQGAKIFPKPAVCKGASRVEDFLVT